MKFVFAKYVCLCAALKETVITTMFVDELFHIDKEIIRGFGFLVMLWQYFKNEVEFLLEKQEISILQPKNNNTKST